MKTIFLAISMSISAFLFGQKSATPKAVSMYDGLKTGKAIMYGVFAQRLGFSSGGFAQFITIENLESGKSYRFTVKPTFKSSKENLFIYHIQPGKYKIVQYEWTQSKWYGGKMYVEQIVKRSESGKDEQFFVFDVLPDKVNYVGTWNFETTEVSFSNLKGEGEPKLRKRFSKINFDGASDSIPQ